MKKTLVSLFLVLTLVMVYIVPAFAITTYYVKTTNGGPVNVRSGPGKQYSSIGSMRYGETVGVEYIANGWASIVWGSVDEAYISASCLSRTKPSSYNPSSSRSSSGNGSAEDYSNFRATNYTVRVVPTNNYVNMRWAPSKNVKVQKLYYLNDTLTVIAEGTNWCQVYDERSGLCGFMQKGFLQRIN